MLIPLGFLSFGNYWISVLGGTGDETARSVATDSINNIYVLGQSSSSGAGGQDFLLAKYNDAGTLQWQRTLGTSDFDRGNSLAVGSDDNIYLTGQSNQVTIVAKYDSSGSVQWQRSLSSNTSGVSGLAIGLDSTNNVYVGGIEDNKFSIVKYNSSGTLQWQKTLDNGGTEYVEGLFVSSSNDIFAVGSNTTTSELIIAKYNDSGSLQWQRKLSSITSGRAITVDSNDDLYITGIGSGLLVAKYDSSGTLQWQRNIDGAGIDIGYAIATDSNDFIYIVGETTSQTAGSRDFIILKYDNSGVLQWQRILGGTGFEQGFGVTIDLDDNLIICGTTSSTGAGGQDFLVAKLPSDGSSTGTYSLAGNSLTYAVSTITAGTPSFTSSTISYTDASGALTSATSSLTAGTPTLTSSIVEI